MKIRKWPIIILFMMLAVSYFPESIFVKGILSFRDLSRYFYPLKFFTVDVVKAGAIPLWNPYILSGTPHLALQQSAIFYPLNIFYYIFPIDFGFNIFLIAHIFLAGLFVYLLSRQWGYKKSSSILAGIIFMFSGYMVSLLSLTSTLSSVIWLPLVLYFMDKALKGRRHHMFPAAIAFAIMYLGGEPSIFYSALWVLFFYSLFFWLNNRTRSVFFKVAIIFSTLTIMAVALSALQLLPFLELLKYAHRTVGASFEAGTAWSLHIKDTFSFIIPFLTRTDFSKDSYWKEQNWVMLIYVGALTVVLIALCLVFRREWRIKFLSFIGLLFLFVSYGNYTPFYQIVYRFVPAFKFVRYPVRFLYVTTFAIAMLSGAGLDAYLRAKKKNDDKVLIFCRRLLYVSYFMAIAYLVLNLYKNELVNIALKFCQNNLNPAKDMGTLLAYIAGILNIKRFLGFVIAGSIILFLGARLKVRSSITAFSFISLVVCDLFCATPFGQLTLDHKTLHGAGPNVEFLKKDKSLFRFYTSPKTREADLFLTGSDYEEAIRIAKEMFIANWPMLDGLYDARGYDSILLTNYVKLLMLVDTSGSPSNTRILDMLNVKYLVTLDKIDAKGYKLAQDRSPYIYVNTNALGRAFLVGAFKVMKSESAIAERLKSKEYDPAREVMLEEDQAGHGSWTLGNESREDSVLITRYSPNEVIIEANIGSPKFLVLADQYYPGWKAYVDNKSVKIYKADFVLRGVYLEKPGKRLVRFLFDPISFKLGSAISICALFFTFLAWPVVFYKRL